MKKSMVSLVLMGLLAGCAGRHEAGAREVLGQGRQVREVTVLAAWFGTGGTLVDVTDRVVELLRSEPQGFTARGDWLRGDPVPFKNKALVIRYMYRGEEKIYIVTGGQRVSYDALVESRLIKT